MQNIKNKLSLLIVVVSALTVSPSVHADEVKSLIETQIKDLPVGLKINTSSGQSSKLLIPRDSIIKIQGKWDGSSPMGGIMSCSILLNTDKHDEKGIKLSGRVLTVNGEPTYKRVDSIIDKKSGTDIVTIPLKDSRGLISGISCTSHSSKLGESPMSAAALILSLQEAIGTGVSIEHSGVEDEEWVTESAESTRSSHI